MSFFKYLIKAPSRAWLDSLTDNGYLQLESVQFPIVPWDREFREGLPFEVIWIRVYGFPLVMNKWSEIEKVFNPFGAYLLEINPATNSGYDIHFLRLKLEMCDRKRILSQLVPLRNVAGKRSMYDLDIEIKTEKTESLNAWARRKAGRPLGSNPSL